MHEIAVPILHPGAGKDQPDAGCPESQEKRKPESNGMKSFRTAHDEEPSDVF
jgi:hypothetical protein